MDATDYTNNKSYFEFRLLIVGSSGVGTSLPLYPTVLTTSKWNEGSEKLSAIKTFSNAKLKAKH